MVRVGRDGMCIIYRCNEREPGKRPAFVLLNFSSETALCGRAAGMNRAESADGKETTTPPRNQTEPRRRAGARTWTASERSEKGRRTPRARGKPAGYLTFGTGGTILFLPDSQFRKIKQRFCEMLALFLLKKARVNRAFLFGGLAVLSRKTGYFARLCPLYRFPFPFAF